MENNTYRVYGLRIPNESIKYIGYTKHTLKRRLNGHIQQSKYLNKKNNSKFERVNHKDNWIRKNNYNIEIVLIEDNIIDYYDALDREIYWIKYYRETLGYQLCNSTDGGEGTVGRKFTDEEKQYLSNLNKGKTLSDEHKRKISKSHKGKKLTPEQIEYRKSMNIKASDNSKHKMKMSKYIKFIEKNGYDSTNLTEEEIIEIRNKIHIDLKTSPNLNNLKLASLKQQMLNIKQERDELREKMKIENDLIKQQNKLLREQDRLKIKEENELKKIQKQKETEKKVEDGLLKKHVSDDCKVYYTPILTDEQKLKNTKNFDKHRNNPDVIKKRSDSMKKTLNSKPKKVLTNEQKENLRQKNLGKKQSQETINKRKETLKNNNSMYSKLKLNDVIEIKILIREGLMTRKEVAEKFNMDYTTICKIYNGQLWKDVE